MLVGLKPAVTPFGRPLAERVTALSNPPETEQLMVAVPAPPCATVTAVGLAESSKAGVEEKLKH